MKKIILAFVLLFAGMTSSYAYNNGVGVFAASLDSQSGYLPTEDTEFVNINATCPIFYRTSFTTGALGYSSPASAYAYLRDGGSYVAWTNFNGTVSGTASGTFTGYWSTLELKISCAVNAIGLAELMW